MSALQGYGVHLRRKKAALKFTILVEWLGLETRRVMTNRFIPARIPV